MTTDVFTPAWLGNPNKIKIEFNPQELPLGFSVFLGTNIAYSNAIYQSPGTDTGLRYSAQTSSAIVGVTLATNAIAGGNSLALAANTAWSLTNISQVVVNRQSGPDGANRRARYAAGSDGRIINLDIHPTWLSNELFNLSAVDNLLSSLFGELLTGGFAIAGRALNQSSHFALDHFQYVGTGLANNSSLFSGWISRWRDIVPNSGVLRYGDSPNKLPILQFDRVTHYDNGLADFVTIGFRNDVVPPPAASKSYYAAWEIAEDGDTVLQLSKAFWLSETPNAVQLDPNLPFGESGVAVRTRQGIFISDLAFRFQQQPASVNANVEPVGVFSAPFLFADSENRIRSSHSLFSALTGWGPSSTYAGPITVNLWHNGTQICQRPLWLSTLDEVPTPLTPNHGAITNTVIDFSWSITNATAIHSIALQIYNAGSGELVFQVRYPAHTTQAKVDISELNPDLYYWAVLGVHSLDSPFANSPYGMELGYAASPTRSIVIP